MENVNQLITRVEALLDRLENALRPKDQAVDWSAKAWRWVKVDGIGVLQAISTPHQIRLEDIQFVDIQKKKLSEIRGNSYKV